MNYQQASLLPRSEKITFVTINSEQLIKIMDDEGGGHYSREVDFFVVNVKNNGTSLTEVASIGALVNNSFYYEISTKKIHVKLASNPSTQSLSFVYKHFLSNAPVIFPYDLATGEDVEWLPLVDSIGNVGQSLDDENTGIVLESKSSVKLINASGYFDEIFDTHIWENKEVKFYKYFGETAITESTLVFDGVIENKSFGSTEVDFTTRDFTHRLNSYLSMNRFSSNDGNVSPSLIGTPKRRIYGQAKQVKCVGISNVLDGFSLTGTINITSGSLSVTGNGTSFLSELSPYDQLVITTQYETFKFGIDSIQSDTALTLGDEPEINFIFQSATVLPETPSRYFNREWHLADHKLREPTTTITTVISANRFELANTEDIYENDLVLINGDLVSVRRISGNELVTNTAVSPLPVVSDTVKKLPIQDVYFGSDRMIYGRDWSYSNNSGGAIITFENDAEFNIAKERSVGVNLTFTTASRNITTTATVDLRTIMKPRDWIRKNSVVSGEGDWYEILDVKEQTVTIRTNYTGTTATTTAKYKSITHIEDESLITADCLGMESGGVWIKTASDVVKDIVTNDAGFATINTASFDQAKDDCDFIMSIVLPESVGGEAPFARDVINKVNESVFGSLYGNTSESVSYSILNSDKPETYTEIKDDDIISWKSSTEAQIKNNVIVNYRPFIDYFTGSDSFLQVSYNSGFVDNYIGIDSVTEKTVYLYEEDKAQIIAERIALFNSLSRTTITLQGKANFFTTIVNDKILLNLDRLFKRFGSTERMKFGIVTSSKQSPYDSELVISDLGNIFNRVPSIAENTANDFADATSQEKLIWGHIVDNDTLTPDITSDDNLGNNIIG
jgi:hypothetical protein